MLDFGMTSVPQVEQYILVSPSNKLLPTSSGTLRDLVRWYVCLKATNPTRRWVSRAGQGVRGSAGRGVSRVGPWKKQPRYGECTLAREASVEGGSPKRSAQTS